MQDIIVKELRPDLSFGARVQGITFETLKDEAVRQKLNDVFEERGVIIFEDIDPSGEMHLALSDVFGPLKDHPVAIVQRVDQDTMPGVIDMRHDPEKASIVEVDGQRLSQWLPWHFDHCYNNELNRAGVLRAIEIAPDGGFTGFIDGIQAYRSLPPALRAKIAGQNILYTLDMRFTHMKFGQPGKFREIIPNPDIYDALKIAEKLPRAIHPAVWTRASGEGVLHISPWMAVGIEGQENPAGDALLSEVCEAEIANAEVYFHKWKPTDMLIWDNWRMLHSVSGCAPQYSRRMHRTTIKGDYGLGRFENDAAGHKALEITV